jgi:UDP-N-acetylglucosamine--N-acetylmuramyl-(pentapeptide) pyrophosphoryl-undecaprenol N-acetylglucosamine transferase
MSKSALRIILSTGGTGGHIFPALSVASAIKKIVPQSQLLFVGAHYGKEKELAKQAGLEFYGLNVRGFKGRGLRVFSALFSMIKAIKESYTLLGKFKPHAVIGFGGYACFATVFSAKLRRIPCAIHEQNAIPGLANKILGRFVNIICLSLPDKNKSFNPKRTILTGNPIREDIANITPEFKSNYKENQSDKSPHVLIMGGSLGATSINSLAIELLANFRDNGIKITHQCGQKDLARVQEAYRSHGFSKEEIDHMLFAFIGDMATCYAKADLALCRAGATSIAELTATSTPAIFIPFPHAANDHQTENARSLERQNAALLFPENELKNINMTKIVMELLANKQKLENMGEAAHKLSHVDAAEKVSHILLDLINKKEK